jgi:hypothetical protein
MITFKVFFVNLPVLVIIGIYKLTDYYEHFQP